MATSRCTYSLPKEHDRAVRDLAKEKGVSASAVIRMALDRFFTDAPIDEILLNEARIQAQRELHEIMMTATEEFRSRHGL